MIRLKDKPLFDKYLKKASANLSKYAFASIFLDQALFKVFWRRIEGCLCVFAQQKHSCYMLLPPLGRVNKKVITECFKIMDNFNLNPEISRIENIFCGQKSKFERLGLKLEKGFSDYIYKRRDLTWLKGNKFKSKRASYNYFIKNYQFRLENFDKKHASGCLKLYDDWASSRKKIHRDSIFQAMIDENFAVHKLALRNSRNLGLKGMVIKIDSKICAYSLGYKLNQNTFCVCFEIADLAKKGIAQFIFKKMCESRKEPFINAMDDSGIDSLKKVKLSYHPFAQEPVFVGYQNQ